MAPLAVQRHDRSHRNGLIGGPSHDRVQSGHGNQERGGLYAGEFIMTNKTASTDGAVADFRSSMMRPV